MMSFQFKINDRLARAFCVVCITKFNFYVKEVYCPGCGSSCCNKCVRYRSYIPNLGMRKVCGRCFNRYSECTTKFCNYMEMKFHNGPMDPVDITKKVDLLENPVMPSIAMYKDRNFWDRFKTGLEPADQKIIERLKKLKFKDKTIALNVDEIKCRLALLKDKDPDVKQHRINMQEEDTRTDQQKTDDLIEEYLNRLILSLGSDSVSEIQ